MVRSRLILALAVSATVPATASAAPGQVTLVRAAGASGDLAWTRTHIARMHGATAWDPATTWIRRSAYALDPATAAAHPEWVLKDAFGTPLYLGSAFAADFGNPAYRAWWIAQVGAAAAGAAGVYVDDVTMERRATYYGGYPASVRDPRTGATMSEANWQRYMADFMVELRVALPGAELVHDVVWTKGDTRPDIIRELDASNAVALEHPAPASPASWASFAGYVERRQASGRGVVLDTAAESITARVSGLATALLLDGGALSLGNDAWTARDRWWSGYGAALGAPVSGRYAWANVWRRDFAGGAVLVNPPGSPAQTVSVGPGFADLDGVARGELTLAPGTGAVLVRVPVSTPPPAPTATPAPPVATPTPAPPPPPRKRGKRSGKAKAHSAGAEDPVDTKTTVRLTRTKVSGRVAGAVSGFTRVTVQRKRGGRWATVRRAKDSVSKRGRYSGEIRRLARGTYRAIARFEGTGTARPSRAERTKSL
jgi:putative glycosyl hydrolase-like family 15 (GHL15) protein